MACRMQFLMAFDCPLLKRIWLARMGSVRMPTSSRFDCMYWRGRLICVSMSTKWCVKYQASAVSCTGSAATAALP
jgi:hypothetical protein